MSLATLQSFTLVRLLAKFARALGQGSGVLQVAG